MRIAIASLAIAILGIAATPLAAQVSVNPKVGVNLSALDTKLQDIDAEARAGWNAGFDLRMGKGLVFLSPGLHYYSVTARLFKEIDSPDDVDLSEETTIQSIRVPVNVGVRLTGSGGLLNLHAKGGIVPAYVINVKERPSFNLDMEDLNRLTWGANVGLGLDVLFFTVDLNYEIGLSKFFKDSEGKNNMLTASVGIKF